MLRDGIIVEDVGIIDARDEEMEVGIDVMGSRGEVVGMEELSSCGIKECEDVVVCSPNGVEIIGEVERGIEIGVFCDTKGVPLVTKRKWDKLISEKECCGNKEYKMFHDNWVVVAAEVMLVETVTGQT